MKLSDYFIQLILLLHLTIVGIFKPEVAERARRMLFLTSLATELAREGIIKRNVLDTLNLDLKLANNERCLLVGCELSKSIWRKKYLRREFVEGGWSDFTLQGTNTSKGQYLPLSDIRTISTRFIDNAPHWVKYNSNRMHEDVTDLFMTHPVLDNARVAS